MDEDRARAALDEMIREAEIAQRKVEKAAKKAAKNGVQSEPEEVDSMTEFKKALWNQFERPYAKYGY